MLNIVIPMAGAGSRFAREGYQEPKPLIPVDGVPMIRLVIENLRPSRPHRFIFLCQNAHLEAHGIGPQLQAWASGSVVIGLDGLTEGAACTVLKAQGCIDNDDPLMIANSDQWVDRDIDEYLEAMDDDGLDGLIMTMRADDPKWSFVGLDDAGLVTRVVEKQVISSEATVGVYNYRHGAAFVKSARAMIDAGERVNGEFYVAPVYNRMIAAGSRIGVFNVGAEADGMYGLGVPQDLRLFQSLPVARKALERCR